MESPADGGQPELPWPRRSSPLRFFHGVLFVLGGGLAIFWSRWGLLLIAVWAIIGLVRLKAKASTLDMGQERLRLDRLRDDLVALRQGVEHPDGSADERLRVLEMLHRLGGMSSAEYEAHRAEIVGQNEAGPAPPSIP